MYKAHSVFDGFYRLRTRLLHGSSSFTNPIKFGNGLFVLSAPSEGVMSYKDMNALHVLYRDSCVRFLGVRSHYFTAAREPMYMSIDVYKMLLSYYVRQRLSSRRRFARMGRVLRRKVGRRLRRKIRLIPKFLEMKKYSRYLGPRYKSSLHNFREHLRDRIGMAFFFSLEVKNEILDCLSNRRFGIFRRRNNYRRRAYRQPRFRQRRRYT